MGDFPATCDPVSHTCVEEITCEGACKETADCQFRCGDTAHVCSGGWCVLAECWSTEDCIEICEPDPGFCVDEFCQCFVEHKCSDYCRFDDECRDWCGDSSFACQNYRCVQAGCSEEECMDQCSPWPGYCEGDRCLCEAGECWSDEQCIKDCYPYEGFCEDGMCLCTDLLCKSDSDCRDPENPRCNLSTGTCVQCTQDWHCASGSCDEKYGSCLDDPCAGIACPCGMYCQTGPGGAGGCVSGCRTDADCCPGNACDVTWGQCEGPCTAQCENSLCGGPDGCGGTCWGQCPDSGKTCELLDGGGYACIDGTCDPNGTPAHGACSSQDECACGNDCVIFGGDIEQPQSFGECLAHCENGGACADPADLCMCTEADSIGACTSSSCFPQGTLKGNFAGKVLNSCQDQPGQTDIGQGNMSLSVAGKSVSFNVFLACHFVDGASDYVVVQGLKFCGQQICPDVLILGIQSSAVKVGTINYQSGSLFTEWMQYTFSGQTVSDVWIRGYGVFGSVTLTAAGKTGKQPISGSADITMIGYNSEVCGGATGIPCQ
jgi:hypothetical protein